MKCIRRLRASMLACTLAASAAPAIAQDDAHMGAFNDAGRTMSDIAGDAAVSKSIRDDAARRQGAVPRAQRQQAVDGYLQSLRVEYERRVARDGRPQADAWLRGVANRLGQQAGRAERAKRASQR